jgi:hypothetical protein
MIEFIAIDKTEECRVMKVQQLSWEEHEDGKLRLYFKGIPLDAKYNPDSSGVCSGFCGDDEESSWMLCQVIKP